MGGNSLLMLGERVRINAALVERYVMELASFDAHGETGVWQPSTRPSGYATRPIWQLVRGGKGWSCSRMPKERLGTLADRESGGSIVTGSYIPIRRPRGRYTVPWGAMRIVGLAR